MEGLFQLLFILFILFLAFADVLGRTRKREGRRGEMERGEGESDAGSSPWESPETEDWGGFEPPKPQEGEVGASSPEAGRSGTESSAADMIPSDVWEEITGGKAQAERREEAGEAGSSGPREPRAEGRRERGPEAPGPRGTPGEGGDPSPSPRPAPSPRPGPSPHDDVPREFPEPSRSPHRDVSRDFPGPPPSPHRRRPHREGREPASTEESPAEEPQELHVPDDRELRRRAMAQEREGTRQGKPRPGPSAGQGGELIPRGDPRALRKAIIYREVLGPPVASRPGGGGWEAELGGIAFSGRGAVPSQEGRKKDAGGESSGS